MTAENVLNPKPSPLRPSPQKVLRRVFLGGIVLLIVLKIVALSPAPLEETSLTARTVNLDELVLKEEKTLAPGIPKGKVPDYTIDQFNYISTHDGEKQWNLIAEQAFVFNTEKIVHSRTVRANLYDTDGKITVVTGEEAKYLTNQSDLEIFGNVKTTFPDGFVVRSDYMRYKPKEKRIEIPLSYNVAGEGEEKQGQTIHFTSRGLEFETAKDEIYLPENVKFTVDEGKSQTEVLSDHCLIHRRENLAEFTMNPHRSNDTRFVRIEQPTMSARGRTGKLKYASAPNRVDQMVLFDDVFVQEFSIKKGVKTVARYGTGGRGDFDSHRNLIILTVYPQVYQDEDTLTGDRIILHRDSDVVEVEHSNGFSSGEQSDDSRP